MFPLDSLYTTANVFLDQEDTIYAKVAFDENNPSGEQYQTEDNKGQFGAFLLEEARW